MEAAQAATRSESAADLVAVSGTDKPAALLRGTARGLEVVVDASASVDAIGAAVEKWLDKAPGFFKGSDVRIRIEDGPLAAGGLGRLDAIALRYDLRIVEVSAVRPAVSEADAIPQPNIAAGSAPAPAQLVTEASAPASLAPAELVVHVEEAPSFEEPTQTAVRLGGTGAAPVVAAPVVADSEHQAHRVVIGPVRSGVILEHEGHLFIFGDVNPGAEIRATGNIVVLGRLRGTAHAGIGQELGFILALHLQPQQLRIGRKVARSGDDASTTVAEIAYLTDDSIVVERYQGKLPRNLASSI